MSILLSNFEELAVAYATSLGLPQITAENYGEFPFDEKHDLKKYKKFRDASSGTYSLTDDSAPALWFTQVMGRAWHPRTAKEFYKARDRYRGMFDERKTRKDTRKRERPAAVRQAQREAKHQRESLGTVSAPALLLVAPASTLVAPVTASDFNAAIDAVISPPIAAPPVQSLLDPEPARVPLQLLSPQRQSSASRQPSDVASNSVSRVKKYPGSLHLRAKDNNAGAQSAYAEVPPEQPLEQPTEIELHPHDPMMQERKDWARAHCGQLHVGAGNAPGSQEALQHAQSLMTVCGKPGCSALVKLVATWRGKRAARLNAIGASDGCAARGCTRQHKVTRFGAAQRRWAAELRIGHRQLVRRPISISQATALLYAPKEMDHAIAAALNNLPAANVDAFSADTSPSGDSSLM